MIKARWFNLVICLLAVASVAGCATPKHNYSPTSIQISEPSIDSVNVTYVGDIMLKQGKYTEHDSIYLASKVRVSWLYSLSQGYYLKQGEDSKTEFYLPSDNEQSGEVEKSSRGGPSISIQAYKNKNTLCVITAFNETSCGNNLQFERKKKPILSSDSFQQTLIYSGKVGSKINIGYREFSKNYARPAFNNDVEYDLSESNIIGYKGARLEIIEATNEFIKYRVIKNFNKSIM